MRLSIVASLLLIVNLACNKQKQFPHDTAEGKNVFGCYVNGKKFLPCADLLKRRLKVNPISTVLPHTTISIEAYNTCDDHYEYGRTLDIWIDSMQIEENKTYKFLYESLY